MNLTQTKRMARRIIRTMHLANNPNTDIVTRLNEQAKNIIETFEDIDTILNAKVAGIPLPAQKAILDRILDHAEALIKQFTPFIKDLKVVEKKDVDPSLKSALIKIRNELNTFLNKIQEHQTYAHSAEEIKRVKRVHNDLAAVKRQYDQIIFSFGIHSA